MCKSCDGWKQSGIDKRDFQHSKDGPEEITRHPKRRSKRWCKNKVGREHDWQKVVWYTQKYRLADKWYERNVYRWQCKGCGKVMWGEPISEHKHCFCETEIIPRNWRNYEMIAERCCECRHLGRSYKFYE